ncbi:related to Mx protein [Fusarium torulosum]|uniref:Related to Mx protein n=1 Tax=Fusarium torulosum TaxID=33205 RepID=A0AAE8SPZ0_9HYPO|nr:related to Mx protein [Fusarium torulosum]
MTSRATYNHSPRSMPRRRGPRGHNTIIKPDPESSGDTSAFPESATLNYSHKTAPSTASSYGGSTNLIPPDQAFYHHGRSDAPTPSERITEPEPLLRELRMRPNAAAESPTGQIPADGSFFQNSFQDIGKELKACNDTLGELQQLGVSHDVPLPELVLVGDQSAGKSSLMSGLANLELPRSEGTCTRCPLHIRVSRSHDPSCRVWLRKEYTYDPPASGRISESDVTNKDPFFPWRKLSGTIIHEFKTMIDHSEIEDVLRWAQIAILNDNRSPELFVPGSGNIALNIPIDRAADSVAAKFSPNIVALEIKGPELPDLSFYDMPGIFQNPADASDDYLVSVVRNLSKEYIQHPSAIIMCSMPMNSDAENSSTFGLVRRLGALNRTIGVLTKADLIPEGGNHEQWLAIMRAQAHITGLGYFITSRPQGKDLDELKQWEELVFVDHSLERWPATFHGFSDRCGVEKLKAFLSEKLGQEFAKSLPHIKQKLKQRQHSIDEQLNTLPELPSNVELEVQTSVMEFGELARSQLKPSEFSKYFVPLPDNFRDCLLDMKPKFTLRDASDIPVVDISDDESDAGSVATITNPHTPSKRRAMAPPITPSKRVRMEQTPMGTPSHSQLRPEESRAGSVARSSPAPRRQQFPAPFTPFSTVGRGFRTLRQVRDEIKSKTRAGVPDIITEEVYNDMCRESIEPWAGPMKAFLNQVMNLLSEMLEKALSASFARLNKRLIYRECKKILSEYLEERRRETIGALDLVYRLETYGLFTVNQEAFRRYQKDEQILLTRYRHQMRMQAAGYGDGRPPIPWESLTEEKRAADEKRRESELTKLGPDSFERELEVVAYVRGYYRLAALRFADAIALHITNGMIPHIQRNLPYHLDRKLGLAGADAKSVYERLMEEDPTTAARRGTLRAEREKFARALESIEELERGSSSSTISEREEEEEEEEHDDDDMVDVALMSGALPAEEV